MNPAIQLYRSGQDRNNPRALTHTYAEIDGDLWPMCGYGWNRSDGEAFSIFRGSHESEGDCGNMFVLNDGTPYGNEMGFCCYCGHKLDQITQEIAAQEKHNE